MDYASSNGHINLLEWWLQKYKQGKVIFLRTELAINMASRNGEISLLNWWLNVYKKHKIPMLYDKRAFERSLDRDVIDWWCKRFVELKKYFYS